MTVEEVATIVEMSFSMWCIFVVRPSLILVDIGVISGGSHGIRASEALQMREESTTMDSMEHATNPSRRYYSCV
jgi:hypothetical protein